jgi:eukaryotic-like serine/threonine-protein kinase
MNRAPVTRTPKGLPGRLADWPGTPRYQVRRCIGSGAVGAVYEALDTERGCPVAVKRLRHFSPAALYLFKQEFRTLADVHHPNLVRLYELVATEDREVFFTMELVSGVDFVAHVRPGGEPDFERVRAALRQLVEGVQALHAAGKLHRDIKPSNVLVTAEGRVALLDFGVATDLSAVREDAVEDQPIVGTASYMAPEQGQGAPPTPASDWYGVGALLFEALVGSAPFLGSTADVLRIKRTVTAPRPSACAHDVPADLDALCSALLQREPEARPSGVELLRLLGVARRGREVSLAPISDPAATVKLVGRREQTAALRDALEATRSGRSVTVRVHGPSGMGKSFLVQAFLDGIAAANEAVVLRGRAYERESVPYKAIDGWVDALGVHLVRLSDRGSLVALPADVWALARLFPVLRRAPEIAALPEPFLGDPHRMRRRAFGALRELLGSLAARQPVVVYVEDAHWGDTDSAALLLDLVRPQRAPSILLVMSYRDDEAEASPFLSELRSQWPEGAEVRDVSVEPLDAEDAAELALAWLGGDDDAARAAARSVADESHGTPFLIEELVRAQQDRATIDPAATAMGLEDAVAERLRELPEESRALIEIIAVSGRPLAVSTIHAAGGNAAAGVDALAIPRARRFVRVGLRNGREVVEMAHDRIRDAVVARIPVERARGYHAALARVLEATTDPDPEAVAIQLVGAGEGERAAPYAERAADRAVAKLAFDRAVQLFRMALQGASTSPEDARRIRPRLAEALAWAGRGEEAARSYLEAADSESGTRRVELERAAAQQLLASGRIDEGAQVLRRVLGAIGMSAPTSPLSALFWLVVCRLRLALMGLHGLPEARTVRPEDRARIEAMYTVAMGFAVVDVLLGACMQARLLVLSLRAGDGEQILRAAALEATQLAAAGGDSGKRERALYALSEALAVRSGSVESRAFLEGAHGVSLFLRGRWKEARETIDASHARQPNTRNQWNTSGTLFAVQSLYFSGEIKELVRRHARVKADAQDRGDLYTTVNFAGTTAITSHLAADDPEGGRRALREGMAQWSQTGFLVQHFQAMAFEPDIDLYLGDGAAAYDRFMRDLPALKRSFLLHVQFVRGITLYTIGRCSVASIQGRPAQRAARCAESQRMARRLEREKMPWTTALSAIVRACAENASGQVASAVASLRIAAVASEAAGLAMHATASRFRLGELLGGQEGEALRAAALEAIASEGIRNVPRWVGVYLPGTWTARPASLT